MIGMRFSWEGCCESKAGANGGRMKGSRLRSKTAERTRSRAVFCLDHNCHDSCLIVCTYTGFSSITLRAVVDIGFLAIYV